MNDFDEVLQFARREDTCSSEEVFAKFKEFPGYQALSSAHALQFAALFGLIPVHHFNFDSVDSTGKSGPTKYLKKHYSEELDSKQGSPRRTRYISKLKYLLNGIKNGAGQTNMTLQKLNNLLCITWRSFKNGLKPDFIFWDGDKATGHFQNFFQVSFQCRTKNLYSLMINGGEAEWVDFYETYVQAPRLLADVQGRIKRDAPINIIAPQGKYPQLSIPNLTS